MANIPLTDIPNAPQSGTPTMQNVNIPTVNLGSPNGKLRKPTKDRWSAWKRQVRPEKHWQQLDKTWSTLVH